MLAGDRQRVEVEQDGPGDRPLRGRRCRRGRRSGPGRRRLTSVLSRRVADDRVVVRAAQDVGDPQRVGESQGQRARDHGLRAGLAEVDRDPRGGGGEVEAGDVGPAGSTTVWLPLELPLKTKRVVAAAADQRVVPRAADQRCRRCASRSGCRRPCRPAAGSCPRSRGVEGEVARAGGKDRVLEPADRGDGRRASRRPRSRASCR